MVCFHEDPCKLWSGTFFTGWELRLAKNMPLVDTTVLAQARTAAVTENTVPFVSASEKVLLEDGLDEEEVQGGAAAAHPDRSSYGGRTKSPRKARIEALLVMAETVVAPTNTEKGNWQWQGRTEVVETLALLVSAKNAIIEAEAAQNIPPVHCFTCY